MKTNILNTMKQFAKYLCAALFVIGTSAHAWGAKVSIKGTSSDTWTYTSSQISITKSGVTLAAKGYGTGTALANEVRVNSGTTITISASQAITKVEFTVTSAATFNQVDFDHVWTGSSTAVDFTAGSGQVVFTECKVTIGGYVILHDFAGDRMVAEGGTLPAVRLGTLKGWASAQYWTHVEVDDGNWPAYGTYYYEGTSAPSKDELWALYQNSCDNSYSTEPTSVYHISETNPASTSGGGTGYVKAYVSSVETYCNIPAGTSVEIRATAEGTPFASWTVTKYGDASTVVTVASSTSVTTTFTMPAYDVSITGEFNGCTSQDVMVYDAGSNESKTCNYGSVTSFDVAYMSDGSGAVTWTSTNTDVATVVGKGGDAATVTIVGAGTANIKATIAEDATYCVGEDVYPLTVNAVAPTVNNTNFSISSTTSTSATFAGGQVSAKGGADIATHGYVVGTASSVTWASGRVSEAGSNSDPGLNTNFTTMTTVTALSSGTTYYVRPFAYNGSLFGYGTAVSFTTPYAVSFDANGADYGDVPATRYIANGSTTTLPEQGTLTKAGYVFEGWAEGSTSGTVRAVGYSHTVNADITFYAKWRAVEYTDAKFSCADWTLTGPSGGIVFITSAASKTVRSQEAFHVSGSGLPHSTALTFTTFPVNTKFEFKKADGTVPATDTYGVVDADVYVFYTPDAEDTSDGLDELTSLTVSVTSEPRTATIDTKRIIGRHLPADFVIAAKNTTTNKWYALPANMSGTGNPEPVEIAVDDINNPTIAYTAASNVYNLYLSADKEKVQLGMKNNVDGSSKSYALWANNAVSSTDIGKNTGLAENTLGNNYKWTLTQTNTSITNPQDAKYTISNLNNVNPLKSWFAAGGGPKWGLYASGVAELRLIPASNIPFTEAYFVEWGQHGGVIEVDATGIDATSVVAHLNGANSSAITLSETQTSGKGRASIYDYTVNFGNDINFAATASNGALLTLEWKNGATTKAMTSLVVPKIIASTSTLSSHGATDGDWSSAEVHVLPGVTLTANAGDFTSNDVMIRHLEIYPGATVVVTKGSQASGTLKVKTLVLRNGWTRAGAKRYDVARLYITPTTASLDKNASDDVWYADWYIDYDQYYPIAVPWDVTLANITYRYCSVEPTVGHDKNIRLRYYDGSSRAGGGAIGTNWKLYGAAGAESVPTKLEPSKGYALTAKRPSGKAFSILRMPLTIPSAAWTTGGEKGEVGGTHKDQVSVTGWGSGTAQWYAMGWNFIGNPYMCTFNGNDDGISGKLVDQQGKGVRYATIPDVDFKNFDQVAIADADLKPASGFFVQAENPEATYITFASSNIVPPSAPARFTTVTENIPDQEAYIRLSYDGGKDQMGLIIGEDYTANYEVNADLAKVLGDAGFVKTYMQYGGMDMAYVAINEMLAKEWIPVTVILPANGEYTYSLTNSSIVNELEGVYLIDYANENKVTNLINENYVFTAQAGTISNRFAINAIVGERETPTDIDVVNGGGDINSDKPFKFIYHEKVYIYHRGVIYDATGKRVKEINK